VTGCGSAQDHRRDDGNRRPALSMSSGTLSAGAGLLGSLPNRDRISVLDPVPSQPLLLSGVRFQKKGATVEDGIPEVLYQELPDADRARVRIYRQVPPSNRRWMSLRGSGPPWS
jgi:hypothetical protein